MIRGRRLLRHMPAYDHSMTTCMVRECVRPLHLSHTQVYTHQSSTFEFTTGRITLRLNRPPQCCLQTWLPWKGSVRSDTINAALDILEPRCSVQCTVRSIEAQVKACHKRKSPVADLLVRFRWAAWVCIHTVDVHRCMDMIH